MKTLSDWSQSYIPEVVTVFENENRIIIYEDSSYNGSEHIIESQVGEFAEQFLVAPTLAVKDSEWGVSHQ